LGVTVKNAPELMYLDSLGNRKFQLKKPIPIFIRQEDDAEWIATFPEAELSRSGDSAVDAITWLKSSIVELYELFKGEDQLGPLPQRQLRTLERYIGEKSHRQR
jgi:hypothetical protein